jgi:hypothetical protein
MHVSLVTAGAALLLLLLQILVAAPAREKEYKLT